MADPVTSVYSVDGNGPAVIFVHGVGARRGAWGEIVGRLRRSFTCITYDLRGHGDSPVTGATFDLADLVADLEALRARVGIDRAHFVGHSLGGIVVPAYAHAYPQHVRSMSLLSTAAFRSDEDRARGLSIVHTVEQNGVAAVLSTLAGRWFTERFIAEHPDLIEARKRDAEATDPVSYVSAFRIYAETDTGSWLPTLTVPALVLTGELDVGCSPTVNRRIADALPDAKLTVLPRLKHGLLVEAPGLVASALLEFLVETEKREAAH